MKVLMFGWEFPPFSRGGLGTACYGLTKGLTNNGVNVIFVVPRGAAEQGSHVDLIVADRLYIDNPKLKLRLINSPLFAYQSQEEYNNELKKLKQKLGPGFNEEIYGRDLFDEVEKYSEKAKIIASFEDFDIIHAHDWMTFRAGLKAKQVSNKPLVVHVHATEFDRTGGNPNQYVYNIEREGLHAADKIIAVSNYTKNKIINHYAIEPDKVEVVYNAIEPNKDMQIKRDIGESEKTVLFLGRITLQKGPDYFIEAAHRVLQFDPNVKFVVAGSGDMYGRMINRAAELGIGHKVLFTGHLSPKEVKKAYQLADLYVMPSVSEPFGITPLEALNNKTPVIISKQSGVSEVLKNALKVDFWDINEMTNKILGVLNYPSLNDTLVSEGSEEIQRFSWDTAAQTCMNIYSSLQTVGI
ncbi:glycosyltransferase family 4 protein [Candidatus Woesearchaeota archaeon]|nr:glycosyltransferase family 4 protein [Candidatus Woesearchaeota archaeon]